MLVALIVAFAAYAPAHLARGICSGSGRFRDYAIVMGSDGVVRIVLCVAARRRRRHGRRAVRVRRRPRPARRRRRRVSRGSAAHRARSGGDVERGHAEPRLAAARLGVRRRAAQRRPDRHHAARRRRGHGAGHPVRLRRAARPHPAVHVPGGAGRAAAPAQPAGRARASSTSSAPGSSACWCVVLARRRRRHARRARARPVRASTLVYDADLDRAHAGHAGARQRLLHGRPGARPGGDRPQGPRPRRRSAGSSASSRSCSPRGCPATTCSSGSRSACSSRRSRRWSTFAIVLRYRLAAGAVPDDDSMLEAITDMPLES